MSRSLNSLRNQSGFTLIELMVVMAIIAILATAGLSAYTGYIKKARDARRIADLNAINTIVLGSMSTTGMPPATALEVYNAVLAANNGKPLADPYVITNQTGITVGSKTACLTFNGSSANLKTCEYGYRICDGGAGFALTARFESASNLKAYTDDALPESASAAMGT